MAKASQHIPQDIQRWIDARRRFHLSLAQVQMARELGMNPRKLGGLANHNQEPWKMPLPVFIEHLYQKRFGRPRPERVLSVEESAKELAAKKAAKKAAKQERRRVARMQDSESPAVERTPEATKLGPGALKSLR